MVAYSHQCLLGRFHPLLDVWQFWESAEFVHRKFATRLVGYCFRFLFQGLVMLANAGYRVLEMVIKLDTLIAEYELVEILPVTSVHIEP